jgi:fumarate reductase subunit D
MTRFSSARAGGSSLPFRWSASHVVTTLSAVAPPVVLVMAAMLPDPLTRRRPSRFAALALFASFLTFVVLLLTFFVLETHCSPFQMGFEGAKVENRVSVHIPDGQTAEEKSEGAILADVVEDLLQSEADGANEMPSTPRAD